MNDPVMIRIVTVLNYASLSILELLEYGVTRQDVNRAMAKGVIEFAKAPMAKEPETLAKADVIRQVLETGDYYFGVLNSKVRLSKIGLYILEILEEEMQQPGNQAVVGPQESESQFGQSIPPL